MLPCISGNNWESLMPIFLLQLCHMLGIDVGKEKKCDGCSLNKGIFQYEYAICGDMKLSYNNDQYKNQNKVK